MNYYLVTGIQGRRKRATLKSTLTACETVKITDKYYHRNGCLSKKDDNYAVKKSDLPQRLANCEKLTHWYCRCI